MLRRSILENKNNLEDGRKAKRIGHPKSSYCKK